MVRVAVLVVPLAEDEIVSDPFDAVGATDTMKVAFVCPAGTVTLGGTDAWVGFELTSVTRTPPAGAVVDSVTVPVDEPPGDTADGLNPSEITVGAGGGAGGVTVSAVDLVVPASAAVRLTTWVVVTDEVVAVNEADDDPAATVTLAGTPTTAGLALDSVTATPPVGAAPLSVTVPVDDTPPTTLEGFTPSEVRVGGLMGPGVQPSVTTSKSLAVSAAKAGLRTSLFQRTSKVPPMYMSEPLSATMRP